MSVEPGGQQDHDILSSLEGQMNKRHLKSSGVPVVNN